MLPNICPCLICLVNQFQNLFSDRRTTSKNKKRQIQSERILQRAREALIDETINPSQNLPVTSMGYTKQKQITINQYNNKQMTMKLTQTPSIVEDDTEDNNLLLFDCSQQTQYGQIALNLPQYGPYYHLLKQKTYNVSKLLNIESDDRVIKIKQNQMQKCSQSMKLRMWRKPGNNYLLEYQLPCSYQTYSRLNSLQIPKLHKTEHIKQFRILQEIQANLSLRYICFEKIGMLESRDFTYIKYTTVANSQNGAHWQICISVDHHKEKGLKKGEEFVSSKPGKLFSISYIQQQNVMEEGLIKLKIKTFVNIDINTSVEKVWQRIFITATQYLQMLLNKIKFQTTQLL